ncbi:FtsH-interacting integral membrane protein [Desulfosporosinus acidiphilus SJ4]|uniref:FtsH-interacting integral membrane protein n=1 Tax=Desulfosporosinus acidiphilus (strain DSM 22704 / JCM 16185 / SJ4) TaxID=646529 RepID=I4D799_DESAJ|nr:Bax inhibitor-1 family protein [Desulfosporosinus acidiphilus]AFM41673.1 FtsH-interacting integral membrane protein [Desulfosporosinus acidiphilus SJ4]
MSPFNNSSQYYQDPYVIDLKKVKTVSLSQVMGFLSFMFLAMAAGAFMVPPQYFMPAAFLELVLIFIIPIFNQKAVVRGNDPAAGLTGGLALLFAACSGVVLAPIVQSLAATSQGLAVLGQAALVTFIVFAAFGLYGIMTMRNLNTMAKALFIGVLVLVGILFLSMFFSSFFSPFGLLIGIGGAILFALMTALDFQRAKYSTADNAVLVTLSIFLDFVNLFTFILNIFLIVSGGGGRKR